MKKTITLTYPAGPERVAAMLADPDYQRKRVERADLSDASIDVAVRGRGFVSTISGSVPPERLPSAAKRFIRSAPSFSLSESWGEPADDGSRTGDLDVALRGAPVKVGATSKMEGSGDSTSVVYDVDLDVSIPLVGRSIEERAMGLVDRAVADEEARGAAWLAEH